MSMIPPNDQDNPDTEAKRPAPKPARAKAVVPEAKPAPARNKPFSMSYGGVTNAEHIANLIARGAR